MPSIAIDHDDGRFRGIFPLRPALLEPPQVVRDAAPFAAIQTYQSNYQRPGPIHLPIRRPAE